MKRPTPARTLAMLIGMLAALVVTSVATAQEAGPPRATTREEWQRVLESQKARVAYSWVMRGMIEATWAHRPVAEVYTYVFTEGTGLALDMVTGGPPAVGASVTKDALFAAAKYAVDHPEAIEMRRAKRLMDEGLAEYRESYAVYQSWKKTGTLTDQDVATLTRTQDAGAKMKEGKEAFTGVLEKKFEDAEWKTIRDQSLKKLAELGGVADQWDVLTTAWRLENEVIGPVMKRQAAHRGNADFTRPSNKSDTLDQSASEAARLLGLATLSLSRDRRSRDHQLAAELAMVQPVVGEWASTRAFLQEQSAQGVRSSSPDELVYSANRVARNLWITGHADLASEFIREVGGGLIPPIRTVSDTVVRERLPVAWYSHLAQEMKAADDACGDDLARAEAQILLHDRQGAIDLISRALQRARKTDRQGGFLPVAFWREAARLFIQAGRVDDAVALVDDVKSVPGFSMLNYPERVLDELRYTVMKGQAEAGDLVSARRTIDQLRDHEIVACAWAVYGAALCRNGRRTEAAAAFDSAWMTLAAAPPDTLDNYTWCALGKAQSRAGMALEAERTADQIRDADTRGWVVFGIALGLLPDLAPRLDRIEMDDESTMNRPLLGRGVPSRRASQSMPNDADPAEVRRH